MTFRRLTAGHAIALVSALALLLAMAPDWWTDKVGQQDRYYQHQIAPQINNQQEPSQSQELASDASHREKNAWQAPGAIDKLILVLLLASAGLAIAAAFIRAGGRRGPPLSAYATIVGLIASVLIAYRIIRDGTTCEDPGSNY